MIKLELSDVNEANKILVALSKAPYEHVFELIAKIRTQVTEQLMDPVE